MRKIIYVLLVIVFFNCSFLTLYYLKILTNLNMNKLFEMNIILFIFSYLYSLIYAYYFKDKFNYLFILFITLFFPLPYLIFNKLSLEEMLFIMTFSSFSFTFISYSIYFDNKKIYLFN